MYAFLSMRISTIHNDLKAKILSLYMVDGSAYRIDDPGLAERIAGKVQVGDELAPEQVTYLARFQVPARNVVAAKLKSLRDELFAAK